MNINSILRAHENHFPQKIIFYIKNPKMCAYCRSTKSFWGHRQSRKILQSFYIWNFSSSSSAKRCSRHHQMVADPLGSEGTPRIFCHFLLALSGNCENFQGWEWWHSNKQQLELSPGAAHLRHHLAGCVTADILAATWDGPGPGYKRKQPPRWSPTLRIHATVFSPQPP